MTFLQHIAVTMATAVLKVATRVCERGMWRGGERMRDRESESREDASEKVGDNVREIQWEEE